MREIDGAPFPSVVLINAASDGLANNYEAHEVLAQHFGVPVEEVHIGLQLCQVKSLADEEHFCESAVALERDLLQIERDNGITLQQMANGGRLIVLVATESISPEFHIALGLLVASMSGAWPEIACVEFDPEVCPALTVVTHISMDLCGVYAGQGRRSLTSPTGERKEASHA
jgi:hypothetical protein